MNVIFMVILESEDCLHCFLDQIEELIFISENIFLLVVSKRLIHLQMPHIWDHFIKVDPFRFDLKNCHFKELEVDLSFTHCDYFNNWNHSHTNNHISWWRKKDICFYSFQWFSHYFQSNLWLNWINHILSMSKKF